MHLFFLDNLQNFVCSKAIVGEDVRRVRAGGFSTVVAIKKVHNETINAEEAVFCTGILISYVHVLTAGHCKYEVPKNEVEIIVGSIDVRAGRTHFLQWWVTYTDWVFCKTGYFRYTSNDLAVFKVTF